jgi:alpha-beta hydrolase superfamily lysophospholipase
LKKIFKWTILHPVYTGLIGMILVVILVNVIAYRQAKAMLNYTSQGERTVSPESLSLLQKAQIIFTGVNVPKPRNMSNPAVLNLPFEVHQLRTHDGMQLEAWYIPHPQSNGVVLMFPGHAAAKSALLPEAKAFYTLGYATFLVDFRGSGGSSGQRVSMGYYEADDVATAFEYVRRLLPNRPVVLYGQSMGSAAILRFVSTYDIQPDAIMIESVFDTMLSTVKNRFSSMRFPSFPSAHLLIFWGGLQSGFSGFRHNPVEYAKMVRCPVLMLHGEKDPRVTVEQSKSVFDNLQGKKQFKLFKGIRHESYYKHSPEEWMQVTSQFLKEYLKHTI